MAKYSFKSSGFTTKNFGQAVDRITQKPIGIKTPLALSKASQDRLFSMHYNLGDQIHDNLRNLLLTNPGERLGRPDFGAGLREMTFEMSANSNYESQVMGRIKASVDKYMPFIELENFGLDRISAKPHDMASSMSKVKIMIEYNVTKLGIIGRQLEIILHTVG